MAVTPLLLTASTQLGTSAASFYTTPASTKVVVRRVVFTNVDTTSRTFTVYRVPSAGAAATGNIVISAQRLSPGEAYIASELSGMVLDAGDALYALASAATAINVTASGFSA